MQEKTIWHDGTDWIIRRQEPDYWYCAIDRDEWDPGVPRGMTVADVALLFDVVLPA